jgi:hypothetical protein
MRTLERFKQRMTALRSPIGMNMARPSRINNSLAFSSKYAILAFGF